MSAGQFNSEIEIIIGTNVDDGMNSLLGALADNSLFDYYQATFNTTAPMQIFDIPFESGTHWNIFTKYQIYMLQYFNKMSLCIRCHTKGSTECLQSC